MYVCDYFDFQMAVSLVNVGFGLMSKPTLLHSGANICSFLQFIFLWCIRKLLFDNINNHTIWCIFRVTPWIKKQFLYLCNTMNSLAFGFWSLEHLIHLLQGLSFTPSAGQINSALRETASFGQISTPSFGQMSTFSALMSAIKYVQIWFTSTTLLHYPSNVACFGTKVSPETRRIFYL